jgi:hypothetical protein
MHLKGRMCYLIIILAICQVFTNVWSMGKSLVTTYHLSSIAYNLLQITPNNCSRQQIISKFDLAFGTYHSADETQ